MTDTSIDSITLEGRDYPIKRILYEAKRLIAGEEDLLKIKTLALRKGRIEEDERLIYDTLGNIVVIELIEDDNETIESDKELDMMDDEISRVASPVRPEKFQLLEKGQNRNFG